ALAGRHRFGRSVLISAHEVQRQLPTVQAKGLRGGLFYHGGQFDDARLLIHLVMTAAEHGAAVLNYAAVTGLTRSTRGEVSGVMVREAEGGTEFSVKARAVVSAGRH